EPIYVGQKPFDQKNGALNLLKHGVGAMNIDGCRVATDEVITNHSRSSDSAVSKGIYGDSAKQGTHQTAGQVLGRHPANVLHDGSDEVIACFPRADSARANGNPNNPKRGENHIASSYGQGDGKVTHDFRDSGSAARFFNALPFTE